MKFLDDENCLTCGHWRRFVNDEPGMAYSRGRCHARPPTPGRYGRGVWPVTRGHHGCGQWTPADDDDGGSTP